MTQSTRFLKSLNTAIDVLELLASEPNGNGLGVSEVSNRLSISKATAHGVLDNLRARNLVAKSNDASLYSLGRGLWQLGLMAGSQIELKHLCHEYLIKLTKITGESSLLAEYNGVNQVLYLEHVRCVNPVQAYVKIGATAPAHCVATGLAMLAYIDETRLSALETVKLERFTPITITDFQDLRNRLKKIKQKGFAVNRGEYQEDIIGVAAPIFNHLGRVVAGISVSGPSYRFTAKMAEGFSTEVIEAARTISKEIGYRNKQS